MNSSRKFIPASGFSILTGLYDRLIGWTMPEKKIRNKLIHHIDPCPGEKIMEFGFGTAQNLIYAISKESSTDYYGLEIDPKILKIANAKLENLDHRHGVQLDLYQGNKFPYKDNTFDKVYSCLVFHHMRTNDKKAALKEILRVLKPNGILFISDWGIPSDFISNMGFYLVQMLDGFETTEDNRQGLIPSFMESEGFENIKILDSVNTKIGTMEYTRGSKSII